MKSKSTFLVTDCSHGIKSSLRTLTWISTSKSHFSVFSIIFNVIGKIFSLEKLGQHEFWRIIENSFLSLHSKMKKNMRQIKLARSGESRKLHLKIKNVGRGFRMLLYNILTQSRVETFKSKFYNEKSCFIYNRFIFVQCIYFVQHLRRNKLKLISIKLLLRMTSSTKQLKRLM